MEECLRKRAIADASAFKSGSHPRTRVASDLPMGGTATSGSTSGNNAGYVSSDSGITRPRLGSKNANLNVESAAANTVFGELPSSAKPSWVRNAAPKRQQMQRRRRQFPYHARPSNVLESDRMTIEEFNWLKHKVMEDEIELELMKKEDEREARIESARIAQCNEIGFIHQQRYLEKQKQILERKDAKRADSYIADQEITAADSASQVGDSLTDRVLSPLPDCRRSTLSLGNPKNKRRKENYQVGRAISLGNLPVVIDLDD